jgi:hypothetical protein
MVSHGLPCKETPLLWAKDIHTLIDMDFFEIEYDGFIRASAKGIHRVPNATNATCLEDT